MAQTHWLVGRTKHVVSELTTRVIAQYQLYLLVVGVYHSVPIGPQILTECWLSNHMAEHVLHYALICIKLTEVNRHNPCRKQKIFHGFMFNMVYHLDDRVLIA